MGGVTRIVFSLLLISSSVYAGQVQHADVKHKQGIYTLTLDMVVDVEQDVVYRIITDHERFHKVSDVLIETRLLKNADNNKKRRLLVVETCIWFFCFKINMTEDVQEVGNELLLTNIVPEMSDFKYGKTQWRVNALKESGSRIQFYSQHEPDFWIPPVIGPLLMKHKMLSEARETVSKIEDLANHE